MKRFGILLLALLSAASLASAGVAEATAGEVLSSSGRHAMDPVVSGGWVQRHIGMPGLVVVDVRTADEYHAGHLAGAVNLPFEVPYSAWTTMRDDLLLELPDPGDLFAVLGQAGIRKDSKVVIVASVAQPPYPSTGATRVAQTLIYAGLNRVSILDGGYPGWVAQGRPTTTVVPERVPTVFEGTVNGDAFADIDYVHDRIGLSLIVDARDAEVYSGAVVEPWADKPGHISSAVSLPAPLIWNEDGTYKSEHVLKTIVRQRLGAPDKRDEIIIYCGVGGYASSWLYVLTKMLAYRNVKMYDGSAQEWVRYHDMQPSDMTHSANG